MLYLSNLILHLPLLPFLALFTCIFSQDLWNCLLTYNISVLLHMLFGLHGENPLSSANPTHLLTLICVSDKHPFLWEIFLASTAILCLHSLLAHISWHIANKAPITLAHLAQCQSFLLVYKFSEVKNSACLTIHIIDWINQRHSFFSCSWVFIFLRKIKNNISICST